MNVHVAVTGKKRSKYTPPLLLLLPLLPLLLLLLLLFLLILLLFFFPIQVQEIKAEPGTPLSESIAAINGCFPEEIVKYYSPGYSETLLQRVESFQPALSA